MLSKHLNKSNWSILYSNCKMILNSPVDAEWVKSQRVRTRATQSIIRLFSRAFTRCTSHEITRDTGLGRWTTVPTSNQMKVMWRYPLVMVSATMGVLTVQGTRRTDIYSPRAPIFRGLDFASPLQMVAVITFCSLGFSKPEIFIKNLNSVFVFDCFILGIMGRILIQIYSF